MAAKPSPADLDRFLKHSPAAHVDNVTAPLCFLIGAKDKRVVMVDSHLYVSHLRSKVGRVPVRVTVFSEDTHALDRPQTEFEVSLTHAWWFKEHM